MTLSEFYDALTSHDWYYMYSDDGRIYRRGSDCEKELRAISTESDQHRHLFEAYRNHVFSGRTFGTEPAPRPDRPA
jgi:hypothetical protein